MKEILNKFKARVVGKLTQAYRKMYYEEVSSHDFTREVNRRELVSDCCIAAGIKDNDIAGLREITMLVERARLMGIVDSDYKKVVGV